MKEKQRAPDFALSGLPFWAAVVYLSISLSRYSAVLFEVLTAMSCFVLRCQYRPVAGGASTYTPHRALASSEKEKAGALLSMDYTRLDKTDPLPAVAFVVILCVCNLSSRAMKDGDIVCRHCDCRRRTCRAHGGGASSPFRSPHIPSSLLFAFVTDCTDCSTTENTLS